MTCKSIFKFFSPDLYFLDKSHIYNTNCKTLLHNTDYLDFKTVTKIWSEVFMAGVKVVRITTCQAVRPRLKLLNADVSAVPSTANFSAEKAPRH